MAVQTIYDTGENFQINSKYDGAVYALSTSDCICQGIGDEFKLNYTSDSLNAYFNEGSQAVIGGSFFKITSLHSITLPSNSTFFLCATIDLNGANGSKGTFTFLPSLNNVRTGNLNGNGTIRDMVLYQITTGSSGVTSIADKRVIKGTSASVSGVGVDVSSTSFSATNGANQTVSFNVTNQMFSAKNASNQQMTYSVQNDGNGNYFGASNAAGKQVGVWVTGNSNERSLTGATETAANRITLTVRAKEASIYDGSGHALHFKVLTQAQYNSISKDGNTLYFVTES